MSSLEPHSPSTSYPLREGERQEAYSTGSAALVSVGSVLGWAFGGAGSRGARGEKEEGGD